MSTHILCLEQKYKKISEFLSEKLSVFLVVKFSIYLGRRVFVMPKKWALKVPANCPLDK